MNMQLVWTLNIYIYMGRVVLFVWNESCYKLGPSWHGPSFMWAELAWADLVLDRVVRNSNILPDCAIPDTSMKFGTVVDHD